MFKSDIEEIKKLELEYSDIVAKLNSLGTRLDRELASVASQFTKESQEITKMYSDIQSKKNDANSAQKKEKDSLDSLDNAEAIDKAMDKISEVYYACKEAFYVILNLEKKYFDESERAIKKACDTTKANIDKKNVLGELKSNYNRFVFCCGKITNIFSVVKDNTTIRELVQSFVNVSNIYDNSRTYTAEIFDSTKLAKEISDKYSKERSGINAKIINLSTTVCRLEQEKEKKIDSAKASIREKYEKEKRELTSKQSAIKGSADAKFKRLQEKIDHQKAKNEELAFLSKKPRFSSDYSKAIFPLGLAGSGVVEQRFDVFNRKIQLPSTSPFEIDLSKPANILIEYDSQYRRDSKLIDLVRCFAMNFLLSYPGVSKKIAAIHNQAVSEISNVIDCIRDCAPELVFYSDEVGSSKISYTIGKVIEEIIRRRRETSAYKNILEYNTQNPDNVYPLILLIIKDFDFNLGEETKNLQNITNLGNEVGVYTVVLTDKKELADCKEAYAEQDYDFLSNFAYEFDYKDGVLKSGTTTINPLVNLSNFDKSYYGEIKQLLKESVKTTISYDDIGFGQTKIEDKYSPVLSIPIGKVGAKVLELPFNCGDDKYGPANSGYIAMGRTSSGKSSFFHSLVINGSMKYSPEDLQFWLLDFKNGGASGNYVNSNIPHISLLSKNNKVEDAYCLFNLLKSEMDRRGNILNEAGQAYRGINFKDLHEYNECVDAHPEFGEHMSRIVVVIDEAQEMFSSLMEDNDDIQKIGALIGTIAVRSRYVGIHMVMIVQNLSMGKSYILKDNFVGNIKGKVTFGIDESFLRESGFGQGFFDKTDDVKNLKQGEAFITCNDTKPDKIKVSYCDPVNFENYFARIRKQYSNFANKMIVIGNKEPLMETNKAENKQTYLELMKSPKKKSLRAGDIYSFTFGEDAYSLKPAEFLFDFSPSAVCAIGTDNRMLSSICRSLLINADSLKQKQIYVCNGAGKREGIFNTAIENCFSSEDVIRKYRINEIDNLVKDVYIEYRRRKRAEEEELEEDYEPIFVIVNDLTSMSKIKANEGLPKTSIISNNSPLGELGKMLAQPTTSDATNFASQSDPIEESLNGRTILEAIREICLDGAPLGIYFNFSSKSSDAREIDEIFKRTTNKIVFNDLPADLSDANCPSYIIHSLLNSVRNDVEKGETVAVSIINGIASKVRPVLYKEEY